MSSPARLSILPAASVLPLPGTLIGGLVAHAHGVAAKAFGVNVLAGVLGLMLVAGLRRISWNAWARLCPIVASAVVLLLASTWMFPSLEGVSRWIILGPVRLNASTVTMPWLLFAVGGLLILGRPTQAFGFTAAAQALHVLQPDAGQATAFGAGVTVLFCATRTTTRGWRIAGSALALVGATAAWRRPDPLGAVPHVEDILHLAADLGASWLFAACLAWGLLLLPFVHGAVRLRRASSEAMPLALAFAVYTAAAFVVTELGNFPVPVLGAGAGPMLGWYSALGFLQMRKHRESA